MPITLDTYKGLSVLPGTPTGAGGLAISDNFKAIADWHPRSVYNKTAAPTASDDGTATSTKNYQVGSLWYDSTHGKLYICTNNTIGSAVWEVVPTSSGNVGFGTTTPRKRLDVLDTSGAQLRLSYTDNSAYTDFQTNSSGNLTITPTGGSLVIGNTTITDGSLNFYSVGAYAFKLAQSNTNGYGAVTLYNNTDGGDNVSRSWVLDRSGNFGIGKAPAARLDVSGAIVSAVVALTDGATVATNAALGNTFTITLGGNRTFSNPTNPVDGQYVLFRIKQDATGSRTITWGTAFRFSGGTAPTLTTTAGKTDYLTFAYNSTDSKWDLISDKYNF